MLVQFLVEGESGDVDGIWKDLFIIEERIDAMYVLDEHDDIVNVLYASNYMTFKRTKELVKYLENRFVYA